MKPIYSYLSPSNFRPRYQTLRGFSPSPSILSILSIYFYSFVHPLVFYLSSIYFVHLILFYLFCSSISILSILSIHFYSIYLVHPLLFYLFCSSTSILLSIYVHLLDFYHFHPSTSILSASILSISKGSRASCSQGFAQTLPEPGGRLVKDPPPPKRKQLITSRQPLRP